MLPLLFVLLAVVATGRADDVLELTVSEREIDLQGEILIFRDSDSGVR
jgi:hypothetical protein